MHGITKNIFRSEWQRCFFHFFPKCNVRYRLRYHLQDILIFKIRNNSTPHAANIYKLTIAYVSTPMDDAHILKTIRTQSPRLITHRSHNKRAAAPEKNLGTRVKKRASINHGGPCNALTTESAFSSLSGGSTHRFPELEDQETRDTRIIQYNNTRHIISRNSRDAGQHGRQNVCCRASIRHVAARVGPRAALCILCEPSIYLPPTPRGPLLSTGPLLWTRCAARVLLSSRLIDELSIGHCRPLPWIYGLSLFRFCPVAN